MSSPLVAYARLTSGWTNGSNAITERSGAEPKIAGAERLEAGTRTCYVAFDLTKKYRKRVQNDASHTNDRATKALRAAIGRAQNR